MNPQTAQSATTMRKLLALDLDVDLSETARDLDIADELTSQVTDTVDPNTALWKIFDADAALDYVQRRAVVTANKEAMTRLGAELAGLLVRRALAPVQANGERIVTAMGARFTEHYAEFAKCAAQLPTNPRFLEAKELHRIGGPSLDLFTRAVAASSTMDELHRLRSWLADTLGVRALDGGDIDDATRFAELDDHADVTTVAAALRDHHHPLGRWANLTAAPGVKAVSWQTFDQQREQAARLTAARHAQDAARRARDGRDPLARAWSDYAESLRT